MTVKHRKKYDDEFKLNAIKFYLEQNCSISDAAEKFDITASMLYKWLKKYCKNYGGDGSIQRTNDQELKILRHEVDGIKEDIDSLKKVLRKAFMRKFFNKESDGFTRLLFNDFE